MPRCSGWMPSSRWMEPTMGTSVARARLPAVNIRKARETCLDLGSSRLTQLLIPSRTSRGISMLPRSPSPTSSLVRRWDPPTKAGTRNQPQLNQRRRTNTVSPNGVQQLNQRCGTVPFGDCNPDLVCMGDDLKLCVKPDGVELASFPRQFHESCSASQSCSVHGLICQQLEDQYSECVIDPSAPSTTQA